jgi:predicted acetyltransferase
VHVAPIPPDQDEAFLRLLCTGFGFDLATARPYFYDDPYYPHNQRWGLWVGEGASRTLVSILTAIPLQIWIDGGVGHAAPLLLHCMGIAGVTTHPQHRRRGYARQLLTSVLNALQAQGVAGAVLQAFDFDFYRPLGWELVGQLTRVRIAPLLLPPFPPTGVRRAYESDHPAIRQLYESQVSPSTGRLLRDELRWRYLLWNFRHKLIYCHDGVLEGYLIYDFTEAGWVLRVRELLWRTERARRALIGWLASNEEHVRHIEFSGTPDDLARLQLTGWTLTHRNPEEPLLRWEVMPNLMWRVVHPQQLLQTLLASAPTDGMRSFCLALQDPQIEANTGIYTLLATAEGWRVQLGRAQELPILHIDRRTLALMTIGSFSAGELVARELLNAPPELLETLERLFPARQPCLRPIDYF